MNIASVLAALAVGFFVGGATTSLHYQAQIADMKTAATAAAQNYQQTLLKRESDYAKRLATATDAKQAEIDRLQSSLSSLRSDAERLRVAATRRRGMSATAGSACQPCQRQVSECVGLLAEGGRLVEEGGELLRDFSADRNAVRKLKQ